MELKGKVHEIGSTQQVSETFKKRDLIIEYAENPTYPEYIKFEASQEKADLIDGLKVGDEVEISFNLRGRPWTDKTGKVSYFNSLMIWRVNTLNAAASRNASQTPPPPSPGEDDDLPF